MRRSWYSALLLIAVALASLEAVAEWASASTTAKTADGDVTIRGLDATAIHEHGGQPAKLGTCRFEIANHGKRSRTIEAEKIDFLTGHDCAHPPETVHSSPKPAGLMVEGTSQRESTASITLEPGATGNVTLGFTPQVDAYYVYCDRFAFRVRFRVSGAKPVTVTAETNVTRIEPLHRQDDSH